MFHLGIFELIILTGIVLVVIGVPVIVLIVVLAVRKKNKPTPSVPPRRPDSPFNPK